MIYGKIWGSTRPLLVTPLVEVHLIDIVPQAHCSEHTHRHKWNAFFCIDGELRINVKRRAYDLVDETTLLAGDFTTVSPGEAHWFATRDAPTRAIEIYYPEPLTEDIVRETVGGVVR